MNNKQPTIRAASRPTGERAYWVPGVAGIALEAALADLAGHEGSARLVISKRTVAGKTMYAFELDKDKPAK